MLVTQVPGTSASSNRQGDSSNGEKQLDRSTQDLKLATHNPKAQTTLNPIFSITQAPKNKSPLTRKPSMLECSLTCWTVELHSITRWHAFQAHRGCQKLASVGRTLIPEFQKILKPSGPAALVLVPSIPETSPRGPRAAVP